MAEFVGAIDQGTTSTRFMIFDHSGDVKGIHQLEHEQILPQAGWVEHNPVEIWERTTAVVQTALNKTNLTASDLAAVGITNQRETTVVWDRTTGRPLYNAIVWQDTRTDRIASALDRDGRGDVIRQKAGLPPATYFSGGKIQWILENVDGVREAAERGDAIFGNTDTWLLWNLTGGRDGGAHVTDPTNASRTMLMNLETLDWDDELLGFFGIPRSMLPQIQPSSHPGGYGTTRAAGPLGGEILLTGDLGDQQAATVGQVCFAPGEAKNTYGTGNFMLLNTGTELVRSKAGLLTTVCYKFGDEPAVYALEGSIAVTGSAVQWLRDQLGIISGAAQSESLARQVEDNGGVCRRSPGCSRRTGARTRAARSSGCRATTPTPTWPGPRSRRSATRAATSPRPWRRTRASRWTCSRSTAGSPPTSCACRSRPMCSAYR
jgi:glycerol kinase